MDLVRFFASVRASLFGGTLSQAAVDGIEAILPAFQQWGDGDVRKLAYILATAHHETGRFRWLREIWGPTAQQRKYETMAALGNNQPGDGKRFMGRGFVHITGRRNYTDWSQRLGIDLVANPELAEKHEVAAQIIVEGMMLGTFTGHGLPRYITANSADYENARRTVNGTDRAALIAGYARQYETALRSAGWSEATVIDPITIEDPSMPAPVGHNGGPPLEDKPTPVEQASKAAGAAKGAAQGSAVAGAIVTLLLAFGWLPAEMNTAEVGAAIGVVLTALFAIVQATVGAYRAPPNAG